MTSLKKNFSMSKLYSDLEKYEANLHTFKESRVRQASQASSSLQKNSSKKYAPINNHHIKTIDRFNKFANQKLQKNKLEIKNKYSRQAREPRYTFQTDHRRNNYESDIKFQKPQHSYFEKENQSIFQESRYSRVPKFSRADQIKFLSECENMYENILDKRQSKQEDTVKKLLKQINKRDQVYELVASRLGRQNTAEALQEFFQKYQRKQAIISQFKKMSKLDIDDDNQLFQVLKSQEQIKTERNQQNQIAEY